MTKRSESLAFQLPIERADTAIAQAVECLKRELRCHQNAGLGLPVDPVDLVDIMSAANETAYTWIVAEDRLIWERNAAQVLGFPAIGPISSGEQYRALVVGGTTGPWCCDGLVKRDLVASFSSPYRVRYQLTSASTPIWVEDQGHLHTDAHGRLVRAVGVVRVINDRHAIEEQLRYRGDYDELTGLLNRRRLLEATQAVLDKSIEARKPAALLMLAVNDLSVMNETFGFEVGEEVIAGMAGLIRDQLRVDDVIGRYCSNKFGVVLPSSSAGSLRNSAERLMAAVRGSAVSTSVGPVPVTISVGGVLMPDQAATAREATERAMQALSKSKLRFGGSFNGFTPSQQHESRRLRNIAVAKDVANAIQDDRFRLALQPVVFAANEEPAFQECLLRLVREDGTVVAAGEFIQVAEQAGLARCIDRRVLELAIGLLEQSPDINVSVNVSGLTCGDHDWLTHLHRLTHGGSLAGRLIVEITETAAIEDLDQSVAFVDALKELGCRVAIDDFGAGCTSFRHLKHLAVDMVKIDGIFVTNLAKDSGDRAFIKALVELARVLDIETVAEFVGDDPTARLLIDAGIDYLQGFHYGRPVITACPGVTQASPLAVRA